MRTRYSSFLVVGLLVGPAVAAAACPDAPSWARTFYRQHHDFYVGPPKPAVLALATPAFASALKAEAAYAGGEVGHLDYDPWLGAQDVRVARSPPPTFTAESVPTAPNKVTVVMRYRFALDGTRGGEPQAVRLQLRRSDSQGCWRLEDFITPPGESLLRIFTRP